MLHKRPRILFVSASGSPIGGVETWLDRIYESLARSRRFEPIVALVRGEATHRPERFREFHPNLPAVEIDGRGLNRDGRVRAVARCIRASRADAVVPLGVIDAYDATIICKRERRPVRLIGSGQGNLPEMLADLCEYRDWFDLVGCVGKLTALFLVKEAKFHHDRVAHLPNGADTPRTPRRPAAGTTLRLGYVGRFTQYDKRVLDLIPFCDHLDDLGVRYSLELVGDGPERARLEAEICRPGRAVRFLGALSHDDVYARVLPNLDVSLLFSASEAFGIGIVEAMANGVVPVTSRYIGFHAERLLLETETGLSFPVGNPAAAAHQVLMLDRDRTLLRSLSQAGTRHAKHYTWEACVARWAEVLDQVMSRPPAAAASVPTFPSDWSSRLDRCGIPPSVADIIRRARRRACGVSLPPGGEEWPLYHRHHSPEKLATIAAACRALDSSLASSARRSLAEANER